VTQQITDADIQYYVSTLQTVMLLTVVANGHNYVVMATDGNAQGRSQDFTLVATEAQHRNIFSQKS